jgi:hypothetical protein
MVRFTKSRIGYLATLGAGILIGVTAVGTATAASSGTSAKVATHHFALAASAFAPDAIGDPSHDYGNGWDPAELSNQTGRCFNAGLALPVNATLKSVTVYFVDGSATMYVEVNRQNMLKHTFALLVHTTLANTTGSPFYTSVTMPVPHRLAAVDMGKYAYSAGVCPNGTTRFSGVIITYTVPAG